MSKRTLLLIIVLALITGILLILALKGPTIPIPGRQTKITKSVVYSVADSTLAFGTLSTSVSTNSANPSYSLPIILKTGENKVTGVQLELLYDPTVLTNVSIEQGTFFNNPVPLINLIDSTNGRVSYALGISPTATGKSGEGTVAILTFTTKNLMTQRITTLISFLPKSLVTAEGVYNKSVLKSTSPTTITLGQPISIRSPVSSTSAK